ncbi:cellulase family glycosylhydrolase [Paenibacillus sp. CF384]|uniref:cellulase family glycosylhydrolase n=1 Tax=Paenibacillus sp. CF384 TaxID=1884382 RepID=UPI00089A6CC4|nr:cellulase family glycosylhydrolase [Paenibacillus sp. CF384]SDY01182.1 Cellulase (glycosyl hydrolase family 5) [Paenibacillus sp. CF384]
MAIPIRQHPRNSRVFEFRGKPLVLVCATEHYGAVINRPFDFAKYLADAHEKQQTLTRLFMLFREQQSHCNPYSTCKPESPDYIAPYPRVGPEKALDWQPKFDLDAWNPEFFDRLHRFLSLASDYGIIVEVVLLSNTYGESVWNLNPLNAANTISDIESIPWTDYNTMRAPKLFERQLAHVRKIVEETNRYDNIFYEICNEPGGSFPGSSEHPTPQEVNAWQMAIAEVIRETEAGLPNKHMIAGQGAFIYEPWEQSSDLSFGDFVIDIVNMHPLPNTTYGGRGYHMGEFMSKQLRLREVRDYCLATRNESKPLNLDEDNVASQYKDPDGWTIHRKRAWATLMSGCHYDYIDFSIINYVEAGTPASQRHIRIWMKHLSAYIHAIDLAEARPLPDFVLGEPKHSVTCTLGIPGEEYHIYVADERELTEEGAGSPLVSEELIVNLPDGNYRVRCFDPATGLYSPSIRISGAAGTVIRLPDFQHDLTIRINVE